MSSLRGFKIKSIASVLWAEDVLIPLHTCAQGGKIVVLREEYYNKYPDLRILQSEGSMWCSKMKIFENYFLSTYRILPILFWISARVFPFI